MDRRCPNCGLPDRGQRDLALPFVCPGCGALLKPSTARLICPGIGAAAGIVLHLVGMRLQWAWLDLLGGAAALAGLLAILTLGKVRVVRRGPACPYCLYDLRNLPEGSRCPECGQAPPTRGADLLKGG